MPLVAHTDLPTYDRLRQSGCEVLAPDSGAFSAAPEVHLGLLNMMPDAALTVTERQFMGLVGTSRQEARFHVHVFSLPYLPRGTQAQDYIERRYTRFAEIRERGLDALIITGANVSNPALEIEPFWRPLQDVIAWAADAVSNILCSCLATHALLKQLHGIDRHPLPSKLWGVYRHRVRKPEHPLLRGVGKVFDVPHSRFNEVRADEIRSAGLSVLAESDTAGMHLAVSTDLCGIVFLQGHPEYDATSLLKEYKREAGRFLQQEIEALPPYPENYFPPAARRLLDRHRAQAIDARAGGGPMPSFPEKELTPLVENNWGEAGQTVFHNWLQSIDSPPTKERSNAR